MSGYYSVLLYLEHLKVSCSLFVLEINDISYFLHYIGLQGKLIMNLLQIKAPIGAHVTVKAYIHGVKLLSSEEII